MLLNTKQVRKIGNTIAGFAAQWTDETSKIYTRDRRSVIWAFWGFGEAEAMANALTAEFEKQGVENKITVTQGMYVRVIADLA